MKRLETITTRTAGFEARPRESRRQDVKEELGGRETEMKSGNEVERRGNSAEAQRKLSGKEKSHNAGDGFRSAQAEEGPLTSSTSILMQGKFLLPGKSLLRKVFAS